MNIDELIEVIPPDVTDPRIQAALTELRRLILARFPNATLEVVRRDDPDGRYAG